MTTTMTQIPLQASIAGFRPLSVLEYNHLTEIGLLTENDNVELLEGVMVYKMPRNPSHDGDLHEVLNGLIAVLPSGWAFRVQSAIQLADSVPEPDIAIVRIDSRKYRGNYPTPKDIGLLVEVSDSTLDSDRKDKCRIYARAGIACYWVVNIPDRQIEVYEQPSGPTTTPGYAKRADYRPGDHLPFLLNGVQIATLTVRDLLD